ncbi:MAG TPA: hypothetical protein VKY26_01130 [Actinomycetota bacterium]|nr:hypothetical protein [Actinomycetota bacterium]
MQLKRALRPRWIGSTVMAAGLAVATLFSGPAAQAATIPLVNLTIPGPIGGVNLCVDTSCHLVPGLANLHIVESLNTTSLTLPMVTLSQQPGCTADVDLQVNITTLGISGALTGSISYDVTDQNGNPIPGDTVTIPLGTIPVNLGSVTHSVSVCAAIL